jgi:BNR/Asp-box repeat.
LNNIFKIKAIDPATQEKIHNIEGWVYLLKEAEYLWSPFLRKPERLGGLESARFVRVVDEDTIVVTSGYKVFISRDHGRTWKTVFSTDKLIDRLHVTRSGTILVGTVGGVIHRSEDLGETWTTVLNLNDDNVSFRSSAEIGDYIFFAAYGDGPNAGKLFRSADDGKTWVVVLDAVATYGERHLHAVTVSRKDIGYVYVTTGDTYHYLLRSTDWGSTWSEYTPTGWKRYSVTSLAESHSHLFLGGDVEPFLVGRIRRDTEAYEAVLSGHDGYCWFDSLKFDERGYVLAGEYHYELSRATGSLWVSPDEGDSWFEYARFPGAGIHSIDVSPDGYIYITVWIHFGHYLVRIPLPSRSMIRSIPKRYTKVLVYYGDYTASLPYTSRREYVGDLFEGYVIVEVKELTGTNPQLTFRLESLGRDLQYPTSLYTFDKVEQTVAGPITVPGTAVKLPIPKGTEYVRLVVEGGGTITSAWFGAVIVGTKY